MCQDGTWFRGSDAANALLPEQGHRRTEEPGLAARQDAGENTAVRRDGTWFRGSDAANPLLPEQGHRTKEPGPAARRDAEQQKLDKPDTSALA